MFPFVLLLIASFLFPIAASPLNRGISIPSGDPNKILCQLPILKRILCPRTSSSAITKNTPLGIASGVLDPDGAYRFSVKYASAARWQPSTIVTNWVLPNGATNSSALPLACPQDVLDPSAYSEDCLSMVLYVPPSLTVTSNAPTFVWIHGGSFIIGSATGPGLDGSKLAIATDSIVAVIQYRLGVLGYMAPNGQTNLALKDTVNALRFLNTVVPSFGGSSSKITIAGQSSGASAIRALLAAPSASSLFRSAVLQSDPMNFGLLGTTTQTTLLNYFTQSLGCGTDAACLNALSLDTIISAQEDLSGAAYGLDPAAGLSEPIRPVLDGTFLTSPLDSTAPFPAVSKHLLVTTVLNEAGPAIYGGNRDPLPEEAFPQACEFTFGEDRTEVIVNSPFYPAVPSLDGSVDSRVQLQILGTDYLWRCSSWTFSRNWVQHGGIAYVGQYVVGATYPGNDQVPYCTEAGVICHQDDIEIVFGTVQNPTSPQAALTTEMQKRYKAFLNTGNPNVAGVPTWTAAGTSDVHPILLGGSGEVGVGACVPSFWGQNATYDYQVFNQ
ncbi:alpha/beta-hydrolase [Pholiota conissans]|uniref:Carboxylic ester hydrolase n=1 Tax=Pholiota conissans TaxID=109636 RepID=A0A9P5Z731_9AGAR|nr:alpha/beta-hydrolase [Pholiota conissans]